MRVVADPATTCHNRTMDLLLFEIEVMAILAKFLHRHDKLVAAGLDMTGTAEVSCIGAMFPIC